MTNFSKQNKAKTTLTILTFVLIFLSSFSVFSQSSVKNENFSTENEITVINEIKAENNKANTNMEFVLWFMGSKQKPNTTISTEGINTKKQIMTSGIAPNRTLLKAFLKKAVNYETSLA